MGAVGPRAATISELLRLLVDEQGSRVVYTHLLDGERLERSITYSELDLQARSAARSLQEKAAPGDRALILAADGAQFIRAFLACQYVGVIAVPAYPPFPMQSERRIAALRAIARDCRPTLVLASPAAIREGLAPNAPDLAALPWIDLDAIPDAATDIKPFRARPDGVAFLQYTSGSTSLPKGVVVTHDALMRNEELIRRSFGIGGDDVIVGWLPLFHDMGLIGNVLQTLYAGARAVLMSPLAFVQRPRRWLDAITRHRGTVSGGPNFAYDLCTRRIPPEEREGLDLRSWDLAFNGAEPVRATTLDAFLDAFGPHGFDAEAWYPCYGLAESTLLATGSSRESGARRLAVDSGALYDGRLVPGEDRELVGSGRPELHRRLEIVDPATLRRVEPGRIGEIWLAGPDVAAAYWGRDEESERTLAGRLADDGSGPFLRTGDLGAVHGGDLFVTGRLKELIIVGGRNHYPQDIEATAESASGAVRRGCCAAFSIERDGGEQVVVVAEVKPDADADLDDVARSIRAAVASDHGIQVDEVALVAPRSVPKTSSGKIQRGACRADFERGELEPARLAGGRNLQGVA